MSDINKRLDRIAAGISSSDADQKIFDRLAGDISAFEPIQTPTPSPSLMGMDEPQQAIDGPAPRTDLLSSLASAGLGLAKGLSDVAAPIVEAQSRLPVPYIPDSLATIPRQVSRKIGEAEEKLNYEMPVSFTEAVTNPSVRNTVDLALHAGVQAAPYLAMSLTGPIGAGVNYTTILGQVAQERADNNETGDNDIHDIILAMPAAVASATLERLGAKGFLSASKGKILANVSREAITEALQEIFEYLGGTLGTKKPLSIAEVADRAGTGMVGGGVSGGVVAGAQKGLDHLAGQPDTVSDLPGLAGLPGRDDLAAAMESPSQEQDQSTGTPPVDPAFMDQGFPPSPDQEAEAAPPAGGYKKGDTIRHKNDFGDILTGVVDSVSETDYGRSITFIDQNTGEYHTIFDSSAPESTPQQQAAPDDVLPEPPQSAIEQQSELPILRPEPKPDQAFAEMSADELQKRLDIVNSQGKRNGWNKNLIDIRDEIQRELLNRSAFDAEQNPTDAQKEAGNYKKGHVSFQGLDITIENPIGSERSGVDADGAPWSVVLPAHYGYIKRTEGADGDHLDVYVGQNPQSPEVFVVDQIDIRTGKFDEHKAFVGFNTIQEAMDAYNAAFSDGRAEQRVGGVAIMDMAEFKAWSKSADAKKPLVFDPQTKQEEREPDDVVDEAPAQEQAPEAPSDPRQGEVGMMLSSGDVVLTTTGRQTTPFPKFSTDTPRKTSLAVKNVEKWLMQNALDEARARGDEFNALQFEAAQNKPSQADKDSAEYYLFDPDFLIPVQPPITRPLVDDASRETEAVQQDESSVKKSSTTDEKPSTQVDRSNVGNDYFIESKINDAMNQSSKSREILVQMTPDDFIMMAEKIKSDDFSKAKTVLSVLELEGQFNELPFLRFENDGSGGARVSAHEGRHRAMALREIGVSTIPVRFISAESGIGPAIRWGEQSDPQSFDVITGKWPSKLESEDGGVFIDFPVPDMRPKQDTQSKPDQETAPATEQDITQPEADQKGAQEGETAAQDVQQTQPEEKPADTAEKTKPGKRMKDVGEKLEGKRAFQSSMKDKTFPEQAKQIIASTKPKAVFNTEKREGQTDGVARFNQEIVNNFHTFSDALRAFDIVKKGSRRSSMPGWEEQVKILFDPANEGAELKVGYWRYTSEQAQKYRDRIIDLAEQYIELGSRLSDIQDNSPDVQTLKMELKNALEDDGFDTLFTKFAKTYGLKRDLFSEYSFSPFGKISDDSAVKKQNRVEKNLTRPKMDTFEREGMKDYRGGADISAQKFMDTFGFRGVEFGEWVSSKEGQAHVNNAFDALNDLATRLNIDPKHISLGGKLGFAFGSRGHGEHAAHYEPDTNVINLTKTKGDGSVAHEWLHALDYNLRKSGDNGNTLMDFAYVALSKEIMPADKIEAKIKEFLKGNIYYQGMKELGPIGMAKVYINQLETIPLTRAATTTNFKRDADALGKDYWGLGRELLARSWEAYIFDTLNGRSPYLVSDWVAEGAVTKNSGYRGTPFPYGDERQRFNAFYDDFLKQVEFSDDGVKFKDGARLSIQDDVKAVQEIAKSFLPKLGDMMKEVSRDGNVQDTTRQGLPDSDGTAGTEDAQGAFLNQEDDGSPVGDRGDGRADVRDDGAEAESPRGEPSGDDRGGSRVQRDDTVPAGVKSEAQTNIKGENFRIAPGALDEKRGQNEKAKDNIRIIRLVKQIEAEGRVATPEEQAILSKFTGWGSIKNAFPDGAGNAKDGWDSVVKEVKEILTDKEYRDARRSIQYAHYTSEIVVRGIWSAMDRFGLKSGTIFEPGMGIGNFIGMKPDGMNISYSGLEIDPMTARIAALLYPQSSIMNGDFTETRYGDGIFSAAIGNPPFSSTVVKNDIKYRKDKLSIHNYFFVKTIDMIAPGGVMGFVTSRYSMDAMDKSARERMAESVDLLGAIRLPDTAFKTNAHTDAVTDIIFLRKRLPGEKGNGTKWMDTRPLDLTDENGQPHHINEYFADNPEMVLGNYAHGSMYSGKSLTVEPVADRDLANQISEAVGRLPEGVVSDIQVAQQTDDTSPQESKEGSYYIKDGTLMQVENGVGIPVQTRGRGVVGGKSKADLDKIRELVPIRDALRSVMDAMVARDDKKIKDGQAELSKLYDAFVKKHGPITKSETESRVPSLGQIESARDDLRNDYLAADEEFNEGDIDLTRFIGAINPETGKKYTAAQIGVMRDRLRKEMEDAGKVVDEGDFDPSAVPDNVTVTYPNLDAFKADPEYFNLMILENYDADTGKATKTDVFSKNIVAEIKKPEIKTAVDALNYSLATKNGVDIDLMAQELGRNKDSIIEELEQLDLIYRLPNLEDTGEIIIHSEAYLSGLVKDKLAYAKRLAESNSAYERNVRALDAVQPKDVPVSDINTQLGAPYFSTVVIEDFMSDEMSVPVTVTYNRAINAYDVKAHDPFAPENTTMHGTRKKPAHKLIESLLMRKDIKVMSKNKDGKEVVDIAETQAAQDKARLIQEKFSAWIWKSKHAETVFRAYNDEFNNIVPRKFDGSHLTTAISPTITLRKHQKDVVWRILQTGNTYVAHAVGAGKTLEMVVAGMEARRLGIWKKPLYSVPNHMLAQFAGEFKQAYPQAKILVADEHHFHADRRKRFVANVAKGDWDAVIMTHSSFKKIPISRDFEATMIERELETYREAMAVAERSKDTSRTTAARIEKKIESLEKRLKSLRAADQDQSFNFEQLGVDALLVDEAHEYRKLSFPTMQGSMKGVTPIGSQQSWDLYIKSKYLDTIHPGRSLVLASGTPLTNTLAEIFTIQRYMNERDLHLRGVGNFDAWSSVYAKTVSNPERQPSGAYKTVTRLAEFMNLGSLSQMVRSFMDTVTSDELGALVDRPVMKSGSMIIRTTAPSREYLAFQKYLEEKTKEVEKRGGRAEKGAENILTIINEGRHAAIDMRLIDPTLPEVPSKLEDMIQNIYDVWEKTSNDKFKSKYKGRDDSKVLGGAQLVFSDLGMRSRTKNGKTFSAYDHIKRKLIRMGVPSDQIAFIGDYGTTEEKRRLQAQVRNGDVRILIGSTKKMGTGMNVQNRLKAVHNLDAPWLPADLEQRTGRALRQGNQYGEIEIYGYGTEGSYDSTMWGMLETKAKAIIQFLKGDGDLSSMRDIEETDHYRIAKAMTSGDPRVLKQAELQGEVERLSRQASNFTNEQVQIKSSIASKKSSNDWHRDRIKAAQEAIGLDKAPEGESFLMIVQGKPYDVRAEAGKAITDVAKALVGQGVNSDVKVGEYRGFDVRASLSVSNLGIGLDIYLDHEAFSTAKNNVFLDSRADFSGSGAITKLTNNINRLKNDINVSEQAIETNLREIKVLESQISGDFPKQKEYQEKVKQLGEIEEDLKKNAPVEVVYDDYPISYWESNKQEMNAAFSIAQDADYFYGPQQVRAKSGIKADPVSRVEAKLRQHLVNIGFPEANVVFYDPEIAVPNIRDQSGRLVDSSTQGVFYKGIVYISLRSDDPIGALNHEVLHALKRSGAIRDGEWQYLMQNAQKWREQYNVDSRYRDLSEAGLNEEAAAHAIQDYRLKGRVEVIRNRIKRFFRGIADAVRDIVGMPLQEFGTTDEIFRAILSGEITNRKEARAYLAARQDNAVDMVLPERVSGRSEISIDDDVPMFSLLPSKLGAKDPLKEARSALHEVKGIDRSVSQRLGKVSSRVLHPRQIAAIFKDFAPIYREVIDMDRRRDVILNEMMKSGIDLYNRLPEKSINRVNAVLELGRLDGTIHTRQSNGTVKVRNSAHRYARLSKPGDVITLSETEANAYYGIVRSMNLAIDIEIDSLIESFGYKERGIKTKSGISKALSEEQQKEYPDRGMIKDYQRSIHLINEMEAAKRTGYVPFSRYGNVGIKVVKKESLDGKSDWFERVEVDSMRLPGQKKKRLGEYKEVITALEELQQKFPTSEYDFEVFETSNIFDAADKINLADVDLLAAASEMSVDDHRKMMDYLSEALKRQGFSAHYLKSNNVPGYEADFQRSINTYAMMLSGRVARRLHEGKLNQHMTSLATSSKDAALVEYAKEYLDYVSDPNEEFAVIRQMAFFWYLAGNLSSGVVNLTQVPVIAVPWLAGAFPYGSVSVEVAKAYKDLAMMADNDFSQNYINTSKASKDIHAAVQWANSRGTFLPVATMDAQAITKVRKAGMRTFDKGFRTMLDAVGMTYSVAEKTNRVVTFIAAYRLAKNESRRADLIKFLQGDHLADDIIGLKGEDFARAFAEYAVVSTQFTMGRLNRPKMGRGMMTMPLQFMSFTMQGLETIYRLHSVHGGKGKRAALYVLLTVVILAGYKGIPFEDDIEKLLEEIYLKATGTDLDLSTKARVKLTRMFGRPVAESIMYGVPYSGLNVDISGRVGLGNILPDDATSALGVWYDMLVARPQKSFDHLMRGDPLRGASEVLPAVLRNPVQAYLWKTSGIKSGASGKTLVNPEDVTAWDALMKSAGFRTSDIARKSELNYAITRANNAVNTLRSRYYAKMAKSYAEGLKAEDRDIRAQKMAEFWAILDEIHAYNHDKPEHLQIILHEPTMKQRIIQEMQGATARRVRGQARSHVSDLREIFGED